MLTLVKGKEINERYVIHDVVGTGGFASVWRASDKQLNRDVALKRLLKHGQSSTENELIQLLEEARKHAQIVHTNIVQVYDVIEAEGEHLIVMEYVDGSSLQTVLRDNARKATLLPLDRAVAVLRDVLYGVAFAHDRQTVHRDLSPSNILLTATGIPKIGDFGIARVIQPPPTPPKSPTMSTQGGTGNPNYMSPEQARGEPADFTSDLFMVGIIGYLLLTGRHPFAHSSGLFEIPELLREENFRPDIPAPPSVLGTSQQRLYREYTAVVIRLLNREKAGRFPTARDAIEAIEAVTPTVDCPACGERVPEHSRFCLFCGEAFAPAPSGATTSPPQVAPPRPDPTADELVEEGFRLSQLKQWGNAIALYREAIKKEPEHNKAYRNLGFALNRVGRHEEAVEILTRALAQPVTARQHQASLLHERSQAQASLKEYDRALEDIEETLRLQPNSIKSMYLKARIHLFRGETGDARRFANEVLRREPDHFGAIRLLAQISEPPVAA